jgi:hypothetical protein
VIFLRVPLLSSYAPLRRPNALHAGCHPKRIFVAASVNDADHGGRIGGLKIHAPRRSPALTLPKMAAFHAASS